MKPRTKRDLELLKYYSWLKPVTNKMRNLALDCCEKSAFNSGNVFWCSVCGQEGSAKEIELQKVVCSTCSNTLKVVETKKRNFRESYYLAYAEEMFEYQVIRLFEVTQTSVKGEYMETNVSENVIQFHTEVDYFLIGRMMSTGSSNPRYGALEIRKPQNYYKKECYNPTPYKFHEESEFIDLWKSKGCHGGMEFLNFDLLKRELKWGYSKTETLLKQKNYKAVNYCLYNKNTVGKFWNSLKIALRLKYNITDYSIWFDYIELLNRFNKDILSPKYICPKDLKAEHDKYVKKSREQQKKVDLARQIKQKEIDNENYQKEKAMYFDLHLQKGDLVIEPLKNIDEFIKESEVLKHCVYSNKYYNKENSLILSAKVNGVNVETIEVDINTLQILQSRGFQNKASEYNKQILELLNNNLHQIAQVKNNLLQTA